MRMRSDFIFVQSKSKEQFPDFLFIVEELVGKFERESVEFVQIIFEDIEPVLKLVCQSVLEPNGVIAVVSRGRKSGIVDVAAKCNVHFGSACRERMDAQENTESGPIDNLMRHLIDLEPAEQFDIGQAYRNLDFL